MQRLFYIDGIKGVSSIIVVLAHVRCAFSTVSANPGKGFPGSFLSDIYNGKMAVAIFVIVSAFIMAQICKDETRYQSLLLKRYFRLLVPCVLPILLMVLCFYTPLGYNDELGKQLNNEWLRWWPAGLTWKNLPLSILGAPVGEAWEWVNVMWMLKYVFLTPFIIVILEIALRNIRPIARITVLVLCLLVSYKYDVWVATIFLGYIFSQLADDAWHLPVRNKKIFRLLLTVGIIVLYLLTCTKAYNDRNNIVKGFALYLS